MALIGSGLLLLLALGSKASALTYYVATTGSDNNLCPAAQSLSTPKRTPASAVPCLKPGDTLYIRTGSYPSWEFRDMGGTATAWIRVKSYPGERAKIDGALPNGVGAGQVIFRNARYIELADLELTNTRFQSSSVWNDCGVFDTACQRAHRPCEPAVSCPSSLNLSAGHPYDYVYGAGVYIAGLNGAAALSEHLILRSLEIHHGAAHGIAGTGLFIEVTGNHIHHLGVRGFTSAYCTYFGGSNQIIRGNRCHDTSGTDGMRLGYDFKDSIVENNISYGNGGEVYIGTVGWKDGGSGITLFTGGTGNIVRNNIAYGNRHLGFYASQSGDFYYNNTAFGNGTSGIFAAPGNTYRNNISYGNGKLNPAPDFYPNGGTPVQSNNLFGVDPKFVNPGAADFRLQSGSPAIDKGMTLSHVTKDFAGVIRPQGPAYDIGAFEYVSGSPAADAAPAKVRGLRWR